MKANFSALFQSAEGEEHFLFQLLNIKAAYDDLKFVLTDPDSGTGGVYLRKPDRIGEGDIVRMVPEVTYHPDGSLLLKMPKYSSNTTTEHINPYWAGYRRTPLSEIADWEPFLVYRVHNYDLCRKSDPSNPVFVQTSPDWFDGTPFECRFFFGRKECPTPIPSSDILVERFSGFSQHLDLVVLLRKISERQHALRIGNSKRVVVSRNNTIEILAERL